MLSAITALIPVVAAITGWLGLAFAIFAVGVHFARAYGWLPSVTAETYETILILGLLGGSIALANIISKIGYMISWLNAKIFIRNERRRAEKKALKNLMVAPAEHWIILLWLKSNGMKRFPVRGVSPTLSSMVDTYLLRHDLGNNYNSLISYYEVTDSVEMWLKTNNPPGGIPNLPKDPPWREMDAYIRGF